MLLVWKNSNTYERNQNKDVIIINNTRTRKESFTPFNNFFIGENKNSKQKWVGFTNNFDFYDCSHEHPELSVPGNQLHAYK